MTLEQALELYPDVVLLNEAHPLGECKLREYTKQRYGKDYLSHLMFASRDVYQRIAEEYMAAIVSHNLPTTEQESKELR